jgi:oligopeptide transport system ATP-binding protein
MGHPILSVDKLVKTYRGRSSREVIRAVNEVSFDVYEGEIVGFMGETGCGKTTIARSIVGLETPDSGRISYDGIDMTKPSKDGLLRFRREVQMVFQNPYSCLNPRMNVEQLVAEGLIAHNMVKSRPARLDRVRQVLEMVGMGGVDVQRYPRSFSGGQRQRIAIARALAVEPRVLLCDEPVSALDVSVQAQVVNLLKDMQAELGLTMLFIAHDPAVLRHLCSRILVMKSGEVLEQGDTSEIFDNAKHSYTQAVLRAIPVPDPALERIRREGLREAALK